jgi:hypothetical protein
MPLPSIQINGFIIERNGIIWSNKIANRRDRFALIKIFLTFARSGLPPRCSQENKRE